MGLYKYDGKTFSQFLVTNGLNSNNIYCILHDQDGKALDTSRYDQMSLYNKEPTVTEIMSIEKMLCGILEANDGSSWFKSMNGVYRYDEKIITDFKKCSRSEIICMADNFKMELCLRRYIFGIDKR